VKIGRVLVFKGMEYFLIIEEDLIFMRTSLKKEDILGMIFKALDSL
jgi:hypothetical protein